MMKSVCPIEFKTHKESRPNPSSHYQYFPEEEKYPGLLNRMILFPL